MSTPTVGHQFPMKKYSLNRSHLVAYANASGDQNPIHQSEEFAKSVGLPNVIAHGMYTMGLAATYVGEIAGDSGRVTEINAKFVKPVVVPAHMDVELEISALVTSVIGSIASVEITVMCEGVKVLAGAKASFTLDFDS
jgi:acyl dehydratase